MRKSYIMVLIAGAAIVASCSDTVKLNNEVRQSTQNQKIGFVTYSEKASRAAEANSVNLYDFHKTFDVYAWKTAADSVQSVFNHVPVEYFTKDTTGSVVYAIDPAKPSDEWGNDWTTDITLKGWFYENVRYWDKLATKYNFYAIAPYQETPSPALHIEDGQDNISIGADNDRYMISTEKNLAFNPTITNERKYFGFNRDYMLAESNPTRNQLVTLIFHHILTKLNVMITLNDNYMSTSTFTINKIGIYGLEDEAYFDYDTSMSKNGWKTKQGSSYDLVNDTAYILKNVPENYPDTIEYSGYYWFQTLIFPQTLKCSAIDKQSIAPAGKYLYINYNIGHERYEAYYDLAYVFNNDLDIDGTYDLKQGSEYTINVKVGPTAIIFDAEATEWADNIIINHSIN